MTTSRAFYFLACLFVVGCGINADKEEQTIEVVQAADGSIYSIPCLREIGSSTSSPSKNALDSCQVTTSAEQASSVRGAKSKHNHGSTKYFAYIYYPPTYYNTSYYDPQCTSSSYNPYRNYSYSSPFCNYVFGKNWNCYSIFGYNNYSYTNSYQPGCTTNSCWSGTYINWY